MPIFWNHGLSGNTLLANGRALPKFSCQRTEFFWSNIIVCYQSSLAGGVNEVPLLDRGSVQEKLHPRRTRSCTKKNTGLQSLVIVVYLPVRWFPAVNTGTEILPSRLVVSQFENSARQVGVAASKKQVLCFAQDDNGWGLDKVTDYRAELAC
jgi:hypothetical protein